MLCPLKLPYNAYRTRKLVSGEHYIDTGYTEHSVYLQMKTTRYMQEVSIKLANLIKIWLFSHQKNVSTLWCNNTHLLTSNILKSLFLQ